MRVLLVDDNVLFLEGVSNMLAAADVEIVGTAKSRQEALSKAEESHPEVILMDIQMAEDSGIEITRKIKAQFPEIKIIMLTVFQDDNHLFEAIKAGASGYLLKGLAKEDFLRSLSGIANGDAPLSPGLASRILSEFARQEKEKEELNVAVAKTALLTPRNIEILQYISSGLTYKEIARKLELSPAAIKYHMSEITNRLQLENKAQVIAFAAKTGLTPLPKINND